MPDPIVPKRKYIMVTAEALAVTFDDPEEAERLSYNDEVFVIDMENHMVIEDGQPKPLLQYKP